MAPTRRLSMTQPELEALVRQAVETVVPAERISSLQVRAHTDHDGDEAVFVHIHYPDLTQRVDLGLRGRTYGAVTDALMKVGDRSIVVVRHSYDVDDDSEVPLPRSKRRKAGAA